MPKPRSRTLSLEGQELFNLALDENKNDVQHRFCLKSMLYNLQWKMGMDCAALCCYSS